MNNNIIDNLNPQQKAAILHTEGPLRIVAGAGSGKTRVLTSKISYLINDIGLAPNKILAVTFTNKAAKEMKTRVEDIIGYERASSAIIATYHSLCVRILREDIEKIDYPKNFNIIDNVDQSSIIRSILSSKNISPRTLSPNKIISFISDNKSKLNSPKELEKEAKNDGDRVLAQIYYAYQVRLEENKSLDFDDLILFVYKLFKQNDDVCQKWSNRFEYILVDEFQDTSFIQYEIIKVLAKNNNITIVGDPDQTIYTWRGADVQLILDFEKDFENGTTIQLEENYRSTQVILSAANKLISYNKNRLDKNLYTNKVGGDKIVYEYSKNPDAEARWVALKIKELILKKVSYSDIAIFYRSNYLSQKIEQYLIQYDIPYAIYGGTKFFQRKEIKDVIAFLKTIVSGETISLSRIINVPSRKLGEVAMKNIYDFTSKKQKKLYNVIKDHINDLPISSGQKIELGNLFNLFEKYKKALNKYSISTTLDKFLIEVGYYKSVSATTEKSRLENIKQLIFSINDWEKKNPSKNVNDYLQEISLFIDFEKEDVNKFVSLMTVHSSKGLEFKNVFIIGFSENIFPSNRSLDDGSMEEERRLAYVAVTRAKERVFLTNSGGYTIDQRFKKKPSRFIEELGINIKDFTKNIFIGESIYDNLQNDFEVIVGDVVIHTVFGEGIILQINDDIAEISFQHPYGIKTLLKNHNSLSKKSERSSDDNSIT